MAKKIRFPLVLAEGAQVRSIEELQEHFDLEAVLKYYNDGKLLTWLEDRYLEEEATAIRALNETAPDFQRQLCEILGCEYSGADEDLEAIRIHQERLFRLRTVTDEDEFLQNINRVAFNQEDLADLLDEKPSAVYLCREEGEDFTFTIPYSCQGITYYGIPCKGKLPQVRVARNTWDKLEELDIHFHSCDLQKPTAEQVEPDELEGIREEPVQRFFQQLLQKSACGSNTELTASFSLFLPGQLDKRAAFQGTVEQLKEKAAELVQKAVTGESDAGNETGFISGLKIEGDGLTCQLRMRSDFSAKAQIQGLHIERGADGGRSIYADLLHPVRLNGRKYRSVQILTAEIFQSLDLLKGSEVEVFCLGDLPPAIRVYERGYGKTLRCPHCGSRFVVRDDRVFCENPVCIDRLHGRIYRFLQKLELPYNKFFVQRMIRELPIKSIKDLFQINSAMLEQYHLNITEFCDFSEDLRRAVSSAPLHVLLGGLGIPELGQNRAKNIVARLNSTNVHDVWGAIMRSLSTLDKQMFETAVDPTYSKIIQRWLRCDPRTVDIFREDIIELQKYINCNDSTGIKSILGPGARIGTDGFEFSGAWHQLFTAKHFTRIEFIHSGTKACWYSHADNCRYSHTEIDAVVVPHIRYGGGIMEYAKQNDIPIFTTKEFLSIFQE